MDNYAWDRNQRIEHIAATLTDASQAKRDAVEQALIDLANAVQASLGYEHQFTVMNITPAELFSIIERTR